MTIHEIYAKLLKARNPSDFFGKVANTAELNKIYRTYAKQVHPDTARNKKDEYIASEAFSLLGKLYSEAEKEFEKGLYGVTDPIILYKNMSPLFEMKVSGNNVSFYENLFEGEVAYIFRGVEHDEKTGSDFIAYMKMAIDASDNELIDKEYEILKKLQHRSLPYVENKIKVNGCSSIIMREVKGITALELKQQYPNGVPASHVMWMLERLFSVIGYLHSNMIIHGNLKPENIIIHKELHNVTPCGMCFAITNPRGEIIDKSICKYMIVNDDYTAPEINKNTEPMPSSDIYSIGKLAIYLLGGNLKSNGMPISIDARVRDFIRRLVAEKPKDRPMDAWKLWSELIKLRTEVYGSDRFVPFD